MTHVKLTYFKPEGKYYSEGEVDLQPDVPFWTAIKFVKEMMAEGNWPGLCNGQHNFHALLTVYTEYGPLMWLIAHVPEPK